MLFLFSSIVHSLLQGAQGAAGRAWQGAAPDPASVRAVVSQQFCPAGVASTAAWAVPALLLDAAALGWALVASLAASPCSDLG